MQTFFDLHVTTRITNSARAIPVDASPEIIHAAIVRLAHELAALADDMHAAGEAAAWLVAELHATIDRLPQSFDRAAAKGDAAAVLTRVAERVPQTEPRDLFLIYVPEDRLTVAAPLAVELTKRRISVAFAEYEVSSSDQLRRALAHGLAHHLGGLVLCTKAFERTQWKAPSGSERIRVLKDPTALTTVPELAAWAGRLRLSKS